MFSSSLLVIMITWVWGGDFLDALKGLEARKAGHILVEDHQVEMALLYKLEGVAAVVHGHGVVALRLQEKYVGLEQVDLVVGPKYLMLAHAWFLVK